MISQQTKSGRARTHAVLGSERRQRLLDVLRESGDAVDAATLADATGLHVTTVRFHLDALAEAGFVDAVRERSERRGRPRLLFTATSAAGDEDSDAYLRLATVLARHWGDEAPSPAERAENAGREWAAAQNLEPTGSPDLETATDRVVAMFNDLGFKADSESRGPDQCIRLHGCPFAAVAREHPEVACAVHLGLLRGALDGVEAPPVETSLEPFTSPNLCIAHIRSLTTPAGED